MRSLLARLQASADFSEQPLQVYRLGIEIDASDRDAFVAIGASACAVKAMTGMCAVSGRALMRRVASQPSMAPKATSIRITSGLMRRRHADAARSVDRGADVKPMALKPAGQHVPVGVIVLNHQNLMFARDLAGTLRSRLGIHVERPSRQVFDIWLGHGHILVNLRSV